jgi:nuclear cap-binding protein subunit 2
MDDSTTVMKSEGATEHSSSFGPTAATRPRTVVVLPPPPRAPVLADQANEAQEKQLYWDRSHYDSPAAQIRALHNSSTLYVGNLAFTTRTQHVRAHFGLLGSVRKIVMGLDRLKKTPCGFCFVEYEERKHALLAVANLSGTKLDGSIIRVELDAGFQPGRQYGRGRWGGQVRHDRKNHDESRKRQRTDGEPLRFVPANKLSSPASAAGDGGASESAAAATTDGVKTEQETSHTGEDEDADGAEPSAKRQRT